ncbi:MAG: phosphomethylpyrimidine synthase, partial [Muribaculaceae bacterium]|nr:phosphomethylpyrimidine synthase [Muribaculaceae bacterium]
MKIKDIDVSSYPNSEKIYVQGKLHPEVKVGMRKVHQYPTVKIEDGKRVEYPNEDITLYDTSGPYTDPEVKIDLYA